MEIRTVRRGLVALAIASTLGLAGAGPAAAEERGWLEQGLHWLAGLWPVGDSGQPGGSGGGLTAIWMMDSVERGYGIDPNGGTVQEVLPPTGGGE